jgi:hypothetical protein
VRRLRGTPAINSFRCDAHFENRTARRAGALNVFIPGGFESNMPAIVEWYRAQALKPDIRG